MQRWRQRREGCSHTPTAAWSPQKLADAGRSLPCSLGRGHSPALCGTSDACSAELGRMVLVV